ncbi:MAG: T9SS type A sorting domain-containing protein [Flavobacteriales bacterium]|nr:T9SS type A sorting domain-containing protein [Flavobacteriales bacterium]
MEKNNKKLQAYSIAAAAVLLSTSASAEIIYTDINPDATMTGDGTSYALDLNGDNQTDFTFKLTRGTDTNYEGNSWTGKEFEKSSNTFYMTFGVNSAVGGSLVSTLAVGIFIDANKVFRGDGNNVLAKWTSFTSSSWWSTTTAAGGFNQFTSPGSTSSTSGNFIDNGAYIGLKFKIGADTHYGWVYVTATDDAGTIKVLSYAYEDIKDYGISAGMSIATGIENRGEKATLYSFGRDIHVKSSGKGTAEVYNLTGQKVASTTLSKGNSRINVRGTSGVYIVKITENGRTSNHKVHLN